MGVVRKQKIANIANYWLNMTLLSKQDKDTKKLNGPRSDKDSQALRFQPVNCH